MRRLANLNPDKLLNILFGWRDDVRVLNFLACADSFNGDKEILEQVRVPIACVRQTEAFTFLLQRIYQKYFWFDKHEFSRITIYLSAAVEMQDGTQRYLPFIGFSSSFSEQKMEKAVKHWHGRYVLRPQGFFVSLHRLGPALSGYYYLPVGLLFKKPLTRHFCLGDSYLLSGAGSVYIQQIAFRELITLAILDRGGLREVEPIGDIGEALPSIELEDRKSQDPRQINLFSLV